MLNLIKAVNKKGNKPVLLAFFITVVGLIITMAVFFFGINERIHAAGKLQLLEMTQQTAIAIKLKLQTQQNIIASLAIMIGDSNEAINSTNMLSTIESVRKSGDLNRIRVTTLDGKSYSSIDNVIDVSKRDYFAAAKNGESGITNIMGSLYDNERIMVIYAPIMRNGAVIGVIHGVWELNSLADAISDNSFGGTSYVCFFTKAGDFILNSHNNDNAMDSGDNWWQYFDAKLLSDRAATEKFKIDVSEDKSGTIDFKFNGEKQLGQYTPIGLNDWYILQAMPMSVISVFSTDITNLSALLVIAIAVLITVFFGAIFYSGRLARKEIISTNRKLTISNSMLNIAFSHISGMVFTYDIEHDKIRFESGDKLPFGLERAQIKPGDLITEKFLTGETSGTFKRLFSRIAMGEREVTGEVKSRFDNEDHWYQIYLTNVFDEEDKPVKAIGTIEDISVRVMAQMQYLQEEKYRYAMLADSRRVYEINLNDDMFRKLDSSSFGLESNEWVPYSSQMLRLANDIVYPEDKKVFLKIAQPDKLRKSFEDGLTELACEYRTVNDDGKILWNQSTTHLLRDPLTGDIMCFTYASDITDKKTREVELTFKAERDPLTGLYNRDTAHKLIMQALESSSQTTLHAFLSVDIDNFKEINDQYGHVIGDSVLNAVAREFERVIRNDDILVRMGGDEFAVFLSNIADVSHVKSLAKRICSRIHSIDVCNGQKTKVSVSIGVALYPSHGVTFDDLYNHSDIALYVAKSKGRDQFAIYFPEDNKIQ